MYWDDINLAKYSIYIEHYTAHYKYKHELKMIWFLMCLQSEELKKEVNDDYMPWVGQYLVMKRASIEPNFHTLYASFVDVLANPEFTQLVIRETFRNIKVRKYRLQLCKSSYRMVKLVWQVGRRGKYLGCKFRSVLLLLPVTATWHFWIWPIIIILGIKTHNCAKVF